MIRPLFTLSSPDVLVTGLRPLGDGKGWQARLYNAGGKPVETSIKAGDRIRSVGICLPSGDVKALEGPLPLLPNEIVTLRFFSN
jgi:hypothetical protein